ncbi:hypothetical protein [Streptomyces sp. NPDC046942]|uniref:hypothetical protein n=1 Tax=Streptomyces sp. NPDC046942 TaxID=3155137 RepID=UPI0033C6FE49
MVNYRLPAHRTRAAVLGALCALVLAGCSHDDSWQPQQRATATSVCDGAFDKQAAQALTSLSDAVRFREVKQKSVSGTFDQLIKDLKGMQGASDADLGRDLCQFSAVSQKKSTPVQVHFDWVPASHGSPSATTSSRTATAYAFARYTKSTDNYAWITFACTPNWGDQGSARSGYLTATVNTYPPDTTDSAKSKSYRDANIRMAYSASAKAAGKIGCFKESGLPKTLGELTARPIAAG